MTDDVNTEERSAGRVRTRIPQGFNKGPVFTTGAIAVALLIPALIWGGIGAASAMTALGATNSTQQTEAPPTPDPGDEVPGADDPVSPPDRNSDQTGVSPQADEIYYIQDGDTLTALSAQFGVSIDYIADYNAVRDVNVISEGAVLRVPFIYVPPAEASLAPAADSLEG